MPILHDRVVAFAGPCASVVAGGIAAWLVAKTNILGFGGIDEANVATPIAGALTFTLVTVLSWRGQSQWLSGGHVVIRNEAKLAAAASMAAPLPWPPTPAHAPPPSSPATPGSPRRPATRTSPPPRAAAPDVPTPPQPPAAPTAPEAETPPEADLAAPEADLAAPEADLAAPEADLAGHDGDVAATVVAMGPPADAEALEAERIKVPEPVSDRTPDAITQLINGGQHGAGEREALWAICQRHDCMPADPWQGYTASEQRWIKEYDLLPHEEENVLRRRELRAVMRERADIIEALAGTRASGGDGRGWNHAHRLRRHRSLRARS